MDTFANMTRQISMIPWLICDVQVVVAMVTRSVISSSEQFSAIPHNVCISLINQSSIVFQIHGLTGGQNRTSKQNIRSVQIPALGKKSLLGDKSDSHVLDCVASRI